MSKRLSDIRNACIYGVRPSRTFYQAAAKYLQAHMHKPSIDDDADHLTVLCQHIGEVPLDKIHHGTFLSFIEARKNAQRKKKTINLALQVARRILNLAATEWIDEHGLTWLTHAPKIKMLKVDDARTAYPLSWDEQDRLFAELPDHLHQMALFKVNTGCREQEVCQLRWSWEIKLPELNVSVFWIPAYAVKNREPRLVVLNDIAKTVIEQQRGQHTDYVFVFCYRGTIKPLTGMNNSAWQRARAKVGLTQVRVHDLKHTFGHRLRAAGVGFEDRQDLLGHKSHRITTHYSNNTLQNLIEAANKVCDRHHQAAVMALLKHQVGQSQANACNFPTMMK